MSEEMKCEHYMAEEALWEGISLKWCTNCGHEELEHD